MLKAVSVFGTLSNQFKFVIYKCKHSTCVRPGKGVFITDNWVMNNTLAQGWFKSDEIPYM